MTTQEIIDLLQSLSILGLAVTLVLHLLLHKWEEKS